MIDVKNRFLRRLRKQTVLTSVAGTLADQPH
jgi:hypothetical protein